MQSPSSTPTSMAQNGTFKVVAGQEGEVRTFPILYEYLPSVEISADPLRAHEIVVSSTAHELPLEELGGRRHLQQHHR